MLLVVRFIYHCFHVVVYHGAAVINKFLIKFACKMFKPTSSSSSSMVDTLWTVNFCIFFVLTKKLKPKIQITLPEKKFRVRILPWLQFD